MNQPNQSGLSPLLTSGITKETHLKNIKNKATTPTFKIWMKKQLAYIQDANKPNAKNSGSAIRSNLRKTKDADGTECAYVVRLLGARNTALEITIGNEKVSIFPQTTFEKARNCLEALVSAVTNDEKIFNEVASQLENMKYENIPNFDEIDALMENE